MAAPVVAAGAAAGKAAGAVGAGGAAGAGGGAGGAGGAVMKGGATPQNLMKANRARNATGGGDDSKSNLAFGTLLALSAPFVVIIVFVVAIFLPTSQSDGNCDVDPEGALVDAPGALGGLYGTGITRAEYNTVRSHPLAGSKLTPGKYLATQYGPPWGVQNGVDQGDGIGTAAGIRLNGGAPKKYFIAVDPNVINYGQWVYVWPNQFGWRGPFLAADTGGAIDGMHIDVYDWRGKFNTLNNVQASAEPIVEGGVPVLSKDAASAALKDTASGGLSKTKTDEAAPPVPNAAQVALNSDSGVAAAKAIKGTPVGYAIVDSTGKVIASYGGASTNRSASVTKSLVLVALTQVAKSRDLSASEKTDATAMIENSDNGAANRLVARVGAGAINAVAAAAGMQNWKQVRRLQTPGGYILGYSQVTAADLARLFARIDQLMSDRHRDFGTSLLENIQGPGRFGIYNAGLNMKIRSKGGWRSETDGAGGWTVNQGAQVTISGKTYGIAVVLGGQSSFEAGGQNITRVMKDALQNAGAAEGDGCGGEVISGEVGEKIGKIARSYLGKNARAEPFDGFKIKTFQDAWCAFFATQVWQSAGVDIPFSAFSGYPYEWAKSKGQLWKAVGSKPRGKTPPAGAALMYGSGPSSTTSSEHINLVDTVNPDGSFMITGGNQDSSRVTRQGPCRMTQADPATISGPGCDGRPIYGIALPTKVGL